MHAARQKTTSARSLLDDCPRPLLVGTVHDAPSLAAAVRLKNDAPDLLEVRLDRIVPDVPAWSKLVRHPLILTARHPREGGAGNLSLQARSSLLMEHLHLAAAVDIELRSLPALDWLLAEAKDEGALRIVSHHDFRGTPTLARLRTIARRAAAAGADVVKIAVTTDSPSALARLTAFAAEKHPARLALMGMGALGRLSRLILGPFGTELVYCSLASANAPGQWPVREYRSALQQIASGAAA